MSGLIKFFFRFRRFFPRFIKLFLDRRLEEYKKMGAIADYKVKARRKGKYHYLFEVDLFLNIEKGGEING